MRKLLLAAIPALVLLTAAYRTLDAPAYFKDKLIRKVEVDCLQTEGPPEWGPNLKEYYCGCLAFHMRFRDIKEFSARDVIGYYIPLIGVSAGFKHDNETLAVNCAKATIAKE